MFCLQSNIIFSLIICISVIRSETVWCYMTVCQTFSGFHIQIQVQIMDVENYARAMKYLLWKEFITVNMQIDRIHNLVFVWIFFWANVVHYLVLPWKHFPLISEVLYVSFNVLFTAVQVYRSNIKLCMSLFNRTLGD